MKRITVTAGTREASDGHMLARDEVTHALAEIRAKLAELAGGYTETRTQGGWIHDGRLITESGRRFTVLADDSAEPEQFAKIIGATLHQHSVALEVEALANAMIVEV